MNIEKKKTEDGANKKDGASSMTTSGTHHAVVGDMREFHNILADIEDLLVEATSLTGEDLSGIATKINTLITSAKDSVEKFGSTINLSTQKTVDVIDDYVHKQPWTAIGMGLGIGTATGLLLGYMFTRRI